MHRYLLLPALLVLSATAAAQSGLELPQRRPHIVPPQVWLADQTLQPIRLQSVGIRIDSQGGLARTRIELSFHNPNPRVLEGELVFPLGASQTVSGYALEVEGKMREGVVVPKQTARVAFEDISRQQIDPGLAEITQGNVFRTRLYPIPAMGNKRVSISFEQRMPRLEGRYRYVLPLSFDQVVERFEVAVEARQAATQGAGQAASPDPLLRFDRAGPAWTAGFVREQVKPQRELVFEIPAADADSDVLEAVDPREPAWRSVLAEIDTGFEANDAAPAPLRSPRRIALYFDASASARGRDLARERSLLADYLQALDSTDVVLVAFRDVAEAPRRFAIRGGDSSALLKALSEIALDGGSNYGAVDGSSLQGIEQALLLGDGLHTFGEAAPAASTPQAATVPLFAVHAAQRFDAARLQQLASRSGGQVISLLEYDTAAAIAALRRPSWQLQSISVQQGECGELLPRAGSAVFARVQLSARCRGPARLALRFGDGTRSLERSLQLGKAAPAEGVLADSIHRLAAQARITALSAEPQPDSDAITALATRYGVVTPYTSLLVLDRIEDYLRYRIEPKEAELRALYHARLRELPKTADRGDAELDGRIERLRAQWREFSDWHGQRHAWLESLLLPAVNAELAAWNALPAQLLNSKPLGAGRDQLLRLRTEVEKLAERWPSEGAEDGSRKRWEREAGQRVIALQKLREARIAAGGEQPDAGPATELDSAGGSVPAQESPMPPPSPSPPPSASTPEMAERSRARSVENSEGLDRITVTGSRIEASPADAANATEPMQANIALKAWNPDTLWLRAVRKAADPYAEYLQQREQHAEAPSFYLDIADHFRDSLKQPALAQRILSNLAEIAPENTALVRILGQRLLQWQLPELAVLQFHEALRQRGEEPQSYRDLALALARSSKPDYRRAAELLWQVASGEWHGRFPGIEIIALHELNDLIARAGSEPLLTALESGRIPAEFLKPLPVGLRVVLGWDADNTDIDLWVTDPLGVEVYYGSNRSPSGGHVSNDFTQGYGPEVFTIRRPLPGTYRVRAHYFGDRRQSLTGPVTVQLEFQTDFGSGRGVREATTRRLETGKAFIEIGEFSVQP